MPEKQKYYKIVQVSYVKNRVRYQSYSAEGLPEELRVHYKVHRWVEAPIGGLLVFDDYTIASTFQRVQCRYEIWQVSVKEEVPLPNHRQFLYLPEVKFYQQFWERQDMTIPALHYPSWIFANGHPSWPTRTRAFKYVKLLKKVS